MIFRNCYTLFYLYKIYKMPSSLSPASFSGGNRRRKTQKMGGKRRKGGKKGPRYNRVTRKRFGHRVGYVVPK